MTSIGMTDKQQLLCPIASVCRLILLNFRPDGTKISISNHAIELGEPWLAQGILRWWNKDGRKDFHVLYAMIVRFIEMYLYVPQITLNKKELDHVVQSDISTSNQSNEISGLANYEDNCDEISDVDVGSDKDSHSTSNDSMTLPVTMTTDISECVKMLACHLRNALEKLAKDYRDDNAEFVLQYYIVLLQDGIDGTYDRKKLPKHRTNIKNILLDQEAIKVLWTGERIKEVTESFNKFFKAKEINDVLAMKSNEIQIMYVLNTLDEQFRQTIIESTR
jgi:hypothetical protein